MSWDREFDEPVPLPRGRELRTLRQAGEYVLKLPKAEADNPTWQNAADALRLVAEHSGPSMFARMAIMAALREEKLSAARRTLNQRLKNGVPTHLP